MKGGRQEGRKVRRKRRAVEMRRLAGQVSRSDERPRPGGLLSSEVNRLGSSNESTLRTPKRLEAWKPSTKPPDY